MPTADVHPPKPVKPVAVASSAPGAEALPPVPSQWMGVPTADSGDVSADEPCQEVYQEILDGMTVVEMGRMMVNPEMMASIAPGPKQRAALQRQLQHSMARRVSIRAVELREQK